MRLENCPVCERHVRPQETRCPFCAAPLRAASDFRSVVLATAVAALLGGCGDDEVAASMGGSADASTAADADAFTSTGTPYEPPNASGMTYAGPGLSWTATSTSADPPDVTASTGETDGSTAADETGSGGTGGTGTGTDTDTDMDTDRDTGGSGPGSADPPS